MESRLLQRVTMSRITATRSRTRHIRVVRRPSGLGPGSFESVGLPDPLLSGMGRREGWGRSLSTYDADRYRYCLILFVNQWPEIAFSGSAAVSVSVVSTAIFISSTALPSQYLSNFDGADFVELNRLPVGRSQQKTDSLPCPALVTFPGRQPKPIRMSEQITPPHPTPNNGLGYEDEFLDPKGSSVIRSLVFLQIRQNEILGDVLLRPWEISVISALSGYWGSYFICSVVSSSRNR